MATTTRQHKIIPPKPAPSFFKRWGQRLAAFDHGYLVLGIVIGILFYPLIRSIDTSEALNEFLHNLVPEAVGMVFTILILDRLADARQDAAVRQQLIRRAHARHNMTALAAIEELRIMGELEDGVLAGENLRGSNWQDCNLYRADLRGTDLTNANLFRADLVLANLEGAKITNEQMASADIMHGAIMPDGSRYDGRFNLAGDAAYAQRNKVDPDSPEEMAEWFGIPLEQYLEAQSWALEHLPRYRKRSTSYDPGDVNNQIR